MKSYQVIAEAYRYAAKVALTAHYGMFTAEHLVRAYLAGGGCEICGECGCSRKIGAACDACKEIAAIQKAYASLPQD